MSTSDPNWWQAVSPYLDQALEMPEEERVSWLASLRERDPALASRLESLLQEQQALAKEGFLEDRPATLPSQLSVEGKVVGAYVLLSSIGEGGMGSVWFAERSDGEIQQRVAIKFLGAGGYRPRWRERFHRERQLLASLNHPSIVHVIDAGHTDEGHPYLVMEYVDGKPIDVYAAQIPIRDRLELFLHVCDAVSHAHRHLIIHRDLKPSNILVGETGQPKLLDFGIAKLLDETGDETQTIERVLTPSYASPEQFHGSAQTTATDVYSLGAVLYKLLTGCCPNELQANQVGVGTKEVKAPTQLNQNLPADIDYILRKALRNEPEERYASVEAFATDIRSLLESRPVEARSGDAWYRARKFLQRYRVSVVAAALVLVSLTAGLYIANHERAIAQRRFQQVRQLANQFIALDAEIQALPGSTKARNRIVSEALDYLATLSREAWGDSDLALEIGNAYHQVARVQGVPFVANLGQFEQAEASLRKAESLVEPILTAEPKNRKVWLTGAVIAHDWMALVDVQYKRDEALVHARKAAARLEKFLGLGKSTPEEIDTATHLYSNIAIAHQNSSRFDEAVVYSRRALEISQSVEAARLRRASALGVMSVTLRRVGDIEGALQAIRESRSLLDELAASGKREPRFNLANALRREGLVLGEDNSVNLNRPEEAVAAFQQSLNIAEDLANQDPNDYRSLQSIAVAGTEIGNILRHSDPRKALSVYDRTLARIRGTKKNPRAQRAESNLLAGSSYAARWAHRNDEARQRIEGAFRLLHETKDYPTSEIEPLSEPYHVLRALADHYSETGQLDKAVETYEELLAKMIAWKPNLQNDLRDATALSNTWAALARLFHQIGRAVEAKVLEDRRGELWKHWDHKLPNHAFVARQMVAAGP